MERMLKYKDFFGFMSQEALYPDQELKRRISKTDRSIAKWLGINDFNMICLIRKAMELHKWIGYKKASNKEITKKEQYFFNTIETKEDETKKLKQNILLATEYGTRDYGIEELENQIENSKYEKVQDISNQPNALFQELLNLDNHNQESTIDESRSKNATSSPSLSIEEEFARETLSFNKNKIKCTIWDIPNETSAARIRKSLSFYRRTTIQSTMANGKSKAMYVEIEEYSRDLERYLKNRPSINLLHESNLEELRESIDTTKLNRIWDSFEEGILYAVKKNIPHKKLKKGAPINIRSNKFNKNSASAILKKDVISLSRIYKSLKCQYKTTKVANLSEDVVANFNHQVREINEKYGLEIMLSSDSSAEDSLAEIKGWWFILNKRWATEIKKEKTKRIEDLVNQRCAMIKNKQGRMIQ
ncbi:36604_t:CDS:2, partial [Gigaspora margarita]